MKSINFLLLAAFQLLRVAAAAQSDLPPIVDLGYALYQATVNVSFKSGRNLPCADISIDLWFLLQLQ
jgi:hypothetical protein